MLCVHTDIKLEQVDVLYRMYVCALFTETNITHDLTMCQDMVSLGRT